jgi:hypothetical protein
MPLSKELSLMGKYLISKKISIRQICSTLFVIKLRKQLAKIENNNHPKFEHFFFHLYKD